MRVDGRKMAEEELKVGLITKRAQKKKSIGPVNYKDRVFVLTPTKLSYYEGSPNQRGKIKESFGLNTISFVGPIRDDALQRTSAFQIIHGGCYLYCCAKSALDCESWIEEIRRACQMKNYTLETSHHPKIFEKGKWQCCGSADKKNIGCEGKGLKFPASTHAPSIPPKHYNMDNSISSTLPISYRSGLSHTSVSDFAENVSEFTGRNQWQRNTPSFDFPPTRPIPQSISNNANWTLPRLPSEKPHVPLTPFKPTTSKDFFQAPTPNTTSNNFAYLHKEQPPVPSYPDSSNPQSFIAPAKYEFTNPIKRVLPPPPPILEKPDEIVVALYDFKPLEPDDLALENGEHYTVVESSEPHWWKVRDKYGNEGFAPCNFLIKKSKDGIEMKKWFQRDITRQHTEQLLKEDSREGTFVVRNSSRPGVVYTLSVISKGGNIKGTPVVKHYHIKQNDHQEYYLSESHALKSIVELIDYHMHNAAGLVTRLRHPPASLQGSVQPTTHLFSNSKWNIDMSEITMMDELGSGQFGVVRLGKLRDKIWVALKIMKEGTMEEENFIAEAEVMTKLFHPNLVELYGVVTKQRPICIVTEFMKEGCLLDYIRKNHHLQAHPDMLLGMCCQVCDAMKYLEEKQMIHRDLAARNCLVGSNNTVKVADFGLTRFVLDDEYTSSVGSKFPIKWAAPEVLNFQKFSSKSDVWAFGVLMWELFTGGKMPYRALGNSEVVEHVIAGHRLERPSDCHHNVYGVMRSCWWNEAEKRPSFERLNIILEEAMDEISAASLPEGMYDAG